MSELSDKISACRLLTFDCYGTLIDWEAGIRSVLGEHLRRGGLNWDEALFAKYVEIEAKHESRPHQCYKDVLTAVEAELLGDAGLANPHEPRLAASVGDWPPFADTVEALQRLAGRFDLGVLSNIDRDLFAQTAKHLGMDWKILVTAEDVGSYKPAPGHFLQMLETTGLNKSQVLHVAQSMFHDIVPCTALGIPCVWINRRGEKNQSSGRPMAVFEDLAAFAGAVLR